MKYVYVGLMLLGWTMLAGAAFYLAERLEEDKEEKERQDELNKRTTQD